MELGVEGPAPPHFPECVMAAPSPCLDICKFDRRTDMCVGCLRTTDEIRQWKKMSDHRRNQILAERRRREAKLAQKKKP